ncbi:hypothetical protein [Desulfocicer niacini]
MIFLCTRAGKLPADITLQHTALFINSVRICKQTASPDENRNAQQVTPGHQWAVSSCQPLLVVIELLADLEPDQYLAEATAPAFFDDQAYTRTNNASIEAERFPFIVNEYPLYNQTGVSSLYIDGITWVTLFSPDTKANGRIVAVVTINGEESGKQILFKNFEPAPEVITMATDVILEPDTARYIVHEARDADQ